MAEHECIIGLIEFVGDSKLATLDELKAQIKADCEMARLILFDNENTSQH